MRTDNRWLVMALLLLAIAGCAGAGDGFGEESLSDKADGSRSVGPTGRWRGQSEFISAAPFQRVFGPALRGAAEAEPTALDKRDVVLSDIYRIDAGVLYNLNPMRGLQTIDLAQPDRAQLLGRAALPGTPHEMYVSNGVATILLNDHFDMTKAGDSKGPAVAVVDARDPRRLVPRGVLPLRGYIVDSRRVGTILYVVTSEWTDGTQVTRVSSISTADVDHPRVVATRDFGGGVSAVYATDQFFFVASADYQTSQTKVQALDIRDPNGAMVVGGSVTVRGLVNNKFQLHLEGNVLRAVGHEWAGGGTAFVTTVSVSPAGRSLRQLGSLDLPGIGTLSATRHDGNLTYLVHAQWIDPLDVIDVSDPTRPVLRSRLEFPEIVSQLTIRGTRALGLARLGAELKVVLFDLTGATRILAQATIGDQGWAWSPALWDDRAYAYLDGEKLLVVPFNSWTLDRSVSAAQLIEVDFAAGTLRVAGRIDGAGDLQRASSAAGRVLALAQRSLKVADVSDRDHPAITQELELARDIQKFAIASGIGLQYVARWDGVPGSELRAVPLTRPDAERHEVYSRIDTGLPAGDLFVDGRKAYVVARTWENDRNTVIVKAFDFANRFAPRILGELKIAASEPPAPEREIVARMPWVQRFNYQAAVQVRPNLIAVGTSLAEAAAFHVISLSDAARPKITKTVALPAGASLLDLQASGGALFATDYEVLPGADAVPVENAAVTTTATAESRILPPFPLYREQAKYFVTRYSFTSAGTPVTGRRINVPGRLMHVSSDGSTAFTLDQRWLLTERTPQQHKHLTSLRLDLGGGRAYLLDMTEVPESVDFVKIAGGYAHYTDSGKWTGPIILTEEVGGAAAAATSERFQLHIKDVRNPRYLRGASVTSIQRDGYGALVDVQTTSLGRFAVVSLGWGGVAFYDVTNPRQPDFEGFVRAPGWWNSQVAVDTAASNFYLAAGDYGVYGLHVTRQ